MKKIILKNSFVSMALQVINIVMNFLTRKLLIQYIGVEWLGINATLASLLSTFSLAELGINSVICFYLYAPLRDGDNAEINHVINIYRILYKCIGAIFLTASLLSMFFVPHILTGVAITYEVYAVYVIMIITSVSSYFLSYRRVLLDADQKQYMAKKNDIFWGLICGVAQIILLIRFKSYVVFLSAGILKTVGSNLYLYRKCGRLYPFLGIQKCSMGELVKTVKKMKEALFIQIASYVYTGTDNLIISMFVNTVQVGYLSNYAIISNTVKVIVRSILYPLTPIIGSIVCKDSTSSKKVFRLCTLAAYAIAGMSCIPLLVLSQDFVCSVFAGGYLLGSMIPILLAGDIVMDVIQIPSCGLIKGMGLFRHENRACVAGALTNIIVSLLLVQRYGIAGVLGGTVVSQIVFFIIRSITVFRHCLAGDTENKIKGYYRDFVKFLSIFILLSAACQKIYQHMSGLAFILRFLCGGILCEILFCFAFIIFWNKGMREICRLLFNK